MTPPNLRILLVDDNPAIHDDFRRVLAPADSGINDLDTDAAALFGGLSELSRSPFAAAVAAPPVTTPAFEVDCAHQGQEALELVRAACAAGRPYALAFVDMRMPPGWDGLTTISKLWELDDELHCVICTAYSDRSWDQIRATLTERHRWLVLKKPFDKIEVLQLAQALTEKWSLTRSARERATALERAVLERTVQLRCAIQVKQEFLANVSHELLTPMNGILGIHQVLADQITDSETNQLVAQAQQCGERLLAMLQQILTFNQADAGTLDLTPVVFSPADLLADLVRTYATRAAHKSLDLRIVCPSDLPSRLHGPAPVLRQALLALVDNAVKFTGAGSVTLSAAIAEGMLAFTINDTGPGLTDEQLDFVTHPFAQVDGSSRRRHSGIGLGLTFAQRLATCVGGTLRLESQPGRGTTAILTAALSGRAG
jgi:signal transduction histidine kinase